MSDCWKVGILFSETGSTANVELSQLHGAMLAIEEINAAGGVLGRPIEAVRYDPGSEPRDYGRLAEKLIVEDRINTLFACYKSSARKEVLPVVERRNALFFYPTIYEGFEFSPNVFYGGAVPNQNSVPLARYLMANYGPRIYFVGSDYIYPHESNRVMRHVLRLSGGEVVEEEYVPLDSGPGAFDAIVARILEQRPDAIFSTVVGQDSAEFYRAYHRAGGRGGDIPVASLTTNEADVAEIGAGLMAGHLTAAPYFRTLETPRNAQYLESYARLHGDLTDVTSCGEAAYIQMHFFAQALRDCGCDDTDALRATLVGQSFEAPQGRVTIDPDNQHTYLHSRIARIDEEGEYVIEHEVPMAIKPDPYLVMPASADLIVQGRKISRG